MSNPTTPEEIEHRAIGMCNCCDSDPCKCEVNWGDETPEAKMKALIEELEKLNETALFSPDLADALAHAMMVAVRVPPLLAYCKSVEGLVKGLGELSKLGNGDELGNSDGNIMAQKLLSSHQETLQKIFPTESE